MAEWFGSDLEMVVLENGDFYHSSAVAVDTRQWTLEHFKKFDDCPAELRQKLAVMIDWEVNVRNEKTGQFGG